LLRHAPSVGKVDDFFERHFRLVPMN
jgi:hypothetical protein